MSNPNTVGGPMVIVALDVSSETAAFTIASKLDPKLCRVKVGKELFTAAGTNAIRTLKAMHFDVFLDLKFHDIPNTVAGAITAAAELGVWMVNVHASGGRKMMEAVSKVLSDRKGKGLYCPIVIGVTVLTSMDADDIREIGVRCDAQKSTLNQVLKLAKLAKECGLDGVVCSGQEAGAVRKACGDEFILVTPGIRSDSDPVDDQKRTVTATEAVQVGSNFLVIGRPVTKADDPIAKLHLINEEIAAASAA